jgi:hypothetical protein
MIINNTTNIKTIDSIPVWGEARHTNTTDSLPIKMTTHYHKNDNNIQVWTVQQ